MLAEQSKSKKIFDNGFQIAKNADLASKVHGKENVVNATLGIFYNDDEEMHTLDIVNNEYKNLSVKELFNYSSSINGEELFIEAVKQYIFGKNYSPVLDDNFTEVIATPGGSGAIYNTFKNYINPGEIVLLPNYMWSSYKLMSKEVGGGYQTYSLFNKKGKFDLVNFKNSVMELGKIQKNLVIVLNNPCHNPTGYTLSSYEIKNLMAIIREACKICNIILINDIAYMDFNIKKNNFTEFYKDLPENLLLMITFSMSKSFCCYGLRVGAQIAISSSKETINNFLDASLYTCRSVWSNIPKGGMTLFSNIVLNKKKYKQLLFEQNCMKNILKERADIFLSEASAVGLLTLPYKSGFFITIPFKNGLEKEIENKLKFDNIFAIIIPGGIRIAICSVPKYKIYNLAQRIKKALS
ncbi:aminotransferase class I/II-fold pyridoxal phosphate-dependent enzyme [Cetobacterium somerae]|uniref:pyridoxal phosphate-dependent aminotransferase n=1 Tax=Cetobacterium sp. NK01 TaxID=2993530 RepID=UPI0021167FC7|nr:aminotransferase class I/II-fold pyridoxal phosphate-dependent enzyme [Cetobacterium sp. NK01]MCQ8211335.1 aminotransferase class I/II-fold pyridoxal phosphate-dependent enzyme [Cetobacterium sp. NK01]